MTLIEACLVNRCTYVSLKYNAAFAIEYKDYWNTFKVAAKANNGVPRLCNLLKGIISLDFFFQENGNLV